MQHISEFKEKYPLTYKKEGLSGPFVMEEIYRQTRVMLSLLQKWDSTRCGRRSIISIRNRVHY